MSNNESNRLWMSFESSSNPPSISSTKSDSFISALWHGIPDQSTVRSNVWKLACKNTSVQKSKSVSESFEKVKEKIEMELNTEKCFAQLKGVQIDPGTVEELLMRYAQETGIDEYIPGSVQLGAIVLAGKNRLSDTSFILKFGV
jgi:hypothetical protein